MSEKKIQTARKDAQGRGLSELCTFEAADIMDFDASRTPRILFKHFGIEDDQSVLEWNKHLSIVGWRLDVDPDGKQQPDLLYSAECAHPVHEKAIREFKTWIDAELSAVRIELDAQRRQLPRGCHSMPFLL